MSDLEHVLIDAHNRLGSHDDCGSKKNGGRRSLFPLLWCVFSFFSHSLSGVASCNTDKRSWSDQNETFFRSIFRCPFIVTEILFRLSFLSQPQNRAFFYSCEISDLVRRTWAPSKILKPHWNPFPNVLHGSGVSFVHMFFHSLAFSLATFTDWSFSRMYSTSLLMARDMFEWSLEEVSYQPRRPFSCT